jgi:hypothetical protein
VLLLAPCGHANLSFFTRTSVSEQNMDRISYSFINIMKHWFSVNYFWWGTAEKFVHKRACNPFKTVLLSSLKSIKLKKYVLF